MNDFRSSIKRAQKDLLRAFSKSPGRFALTGGTALELYYLRHRMSLDLDLFSPHYDTREIGPIVRNIKKDCRASVKLENEFISADHARARFYTASFKGGGKGVIKIDFVEDVLFDKPDIRLFAGVPVYSVENIYLQKITAITGLRMREDDTGREFMQGRREARDAFDIYMLSKKVKPLRIFLKGLPNQIQRGMAHWYQTFSRHDLKTGLLDMDIYDKSFDSREMIVYLEGQIKAFVKEALEQ